MQLLDHAIAILLFIVVGTGVPVIHTIPHSVVKQDRNLAGCGGHCFGRADASCKTSVERAERGVAPSNGDGCQSNRDGQPAIGLAPMVLVLLPHSQAEVADGSPYRLKPRRREPLVM